MIAIAWMSAGAVLTVLYFVFTHRRRTPYLELDLDSLPPLKDGLQTLAGLTGGAVHAGNRVTVLQNGGLFPAMQADIEAARYSVHLETFVWDAGQLEQRVVELLCAKTREGVKVRVLIDAVGGSSASGKCLGRLSGGGVELSQYCRPRWWNLRRFNHRTHRKILVVDGEIGYTFGHGIADQWLGDGEDQDHWRDTAVRIEGPAVAALQSVFMENWIEETQRVPSGPGCFPKLAPKGAVSAHVVSSASGEAGSAVALLYTVAIASARSEVIIQNPYFVPDDGVCELLATMVKRGVAVHLMVPGRRRTAPSSIWPGAICTNHCCGQACACTSSSRRCCIRRSSLSTASGRMSVRQTSIRALSRSTKKSESGCWTKTSPRNSRTHLPLTCDAAPNSDSNVGASDH